jgi:hypothetical protein
LGFVHEGFVDYSDLENEIWFFGSGFALILAGIINIMASYSSEKTVLLISLITNFVVTILFIIALRFLMQPQVLTGFLIFAIATYGNFVKRKRL